MTPDELRALKDAATPGPWAWAYDNALVGDFHEAGGDEPAWSLVAAIHDNGPVRGGDARLIASSPMLAEELANAMEALEAYDNPLLKTAHAALARLRERKLP